MKDSKYILERKNPQTGFKETIVYTGNLRDKPKGWKVVSGDIKNIV
jgi:hypothetical protein